MKQKRYWLRGGVIAVIVGIFFLTINFIATESFNTEAFNYPLIVGIFLAIIFNYLILKCVFLDFQGINPNYCETTAAVFGIAFNLIVYFLAGMLVGLIYGKIRNRDKSTIS